MARIQASRRCVYCGDNGRLCDSRPPGAWPSISARLLSAALEAGQIPTRENGCLWRFADAIDPRRGHALHVLASNIMRCLLSRAIPSSVWNRAVCVHTLASICCPTLLCSSVGTRLHPPSRKTPQQTTAALRIFSISDAVLLQQQRPAASGGICVVEAKAYIHRGRDGTPNSHGRHLFPPHLLLRLLLPLALVASHHDRLLHHGLQPKALFPLCEIGVL